MRKNDFYRPSMASLGKKRRVVRRKKGSSFFSKLFVLLVLAGIGYGGYWACAKGYEALVRSRVSNWHVKQVVVNGLSGNLQKEVASLASGYPGKPFSVKEAVALRGQIIQKYPMLKEVSVKRGLLSGNLTITAHHRKPLAKFVLPDKTVKYIDPDSTIYTDTNPDSLQNVPFVELEGTVPEKLGAEFVDLVESTLRLNKELDFAFLRMNLAENTVKMYMPDGSVIDFGRAVHLKKKAARAAQILTFAHGKYQAPFTLNFQFFEKGKVFLTQKAH